VDPDIFDITTFNFHNTPEKINQREIMLNGEWPGDGSFKFGTTTCSSYCGKLESTGKGISDRQFFSRIPNLSPPELEVTPFATAVQPTILEVVMDNVCNLGCIYCMPDLSSRLDTEMKRYGKFEKNGIVLESTFQKRHDFDEIQKKFWEWMAGNADKLERFQLLGGEPFHQKQFELFFDFFEKNPCPSLEFNIVTNLMISKPRLIFYMQKFKDLIIRKKIKRLDITASIDCWGPQQEYVRHGLNLRSWHDNFEFLLSEKWIKLNINSTISVLTIKTHALLLEKFNQWNKIRKIEHYFGTVFRPTYLAPEILGPDEFQEDFNKIKILLENNQKDFRGDLAFQQMEGIISVIEDSPINKEEISKLITFLNENDRRRNSDWRKLFPWLEKYVV
jgi:sulfatase maturation enzyme AslB (radical SAM superfamily)